MPKVFDALRTNAAYFFLLVGVVWLGVAVLFGSLLILWPVAACLVGGLLLKARPGRKITGAWAVSSGALGLIISAYQVYAWYPFLGSAFSALASTTLAGFTVFAVVHVFLVYAGASRTKAKSTPS